MIDAKRDIKIFTGIMDKDTEARYLDQNNYRYLLNARSSINSEGSFGAIEDVMGNVLVNNPFLTNGRNKVIGSYEDIAGQSCIFFVWNEFGYHGIYRWYANRTGFPNGVIEKVYQVVDPVDNCLDFQEYNLINHVNLAGDLLLWVDGAEEPRCMNIVRADRTNKNLTFNLFFNPSNFGVVTNYTLTIYGAVTYTLAWTSSGTDYENQVNDFYNAALADPNVVNLVNVIKRINYAEIEFLSPGDFMLSASAPLFVLPENFYPDQSNNPVTYAPLNKQLITNVKYPPFCAPHVQYISTTVNPSLLTKALFRPFTYSDPTSTFKFNGYVGINAPSPNYVDNLNIVVPGANNVLQWLPPFGTFPDPAANTPLGYITNNTAQTKVYQINLQGYVQNTGAAISFNLTFGKLNSSNPALAPVSPAVTIFGNPINLSSFNVTVTVSIAPGEIFGLYTFGQGQYTISGPNGGVELTAIEINNLSTTLVYPDIQENFYQFRAKYVYDDNQESVYGAISSIALPGNLFDDAINIDFSDPRLSTPELVCDIKKVVLAYTRDNGTIWYDFKELEPYEFAGPGKQVYIFNGKENAIAVPSAEASLLFHNVPLVSRAQEFVDDRIFYGANLTGYNKVIANMAFDYFYEDLINTLEQTGKTSKLGWKRGYEGYIGIVYYDDADRKSPVIIDTNSSKIRIPYYWDGGQASTWDAVQLKWQIFHEPPDYAKKYQLVRTKDLTQTRYLIWVADYRYVAKDLTTLTTPAAGAYIRFDMANVAYYNDFDNLGSRIEVTVATGDRLRFITTTANSTNFNNIPNDFKIVASDSQYIYIENPQWSAINTGLNENYRGRYIEIYTPNLNNNDEVFYEFSECYEVKEGLFNGKLRKYHAGPIDQDYTINQPAEGISYEGNVFYRYREIPYDYTAPNWLSTVNQVITAYTPSDYSNQFFDNNGRVNSTNFTEQEFDGASLIFTDRYTNLVKSINGINAVQAGNSTSYNTEYGNVVKLQVVNNDILKLVFSNSYQLSIYVSQGVIRQSQANVNLIAVSDEVAGNSHIIQRTLGTINAESVRVNDEGDMFGYDATEGIIWISSGNGLIQISDRGMKSVFKKYTNERKVVPGISETPCVYDLYHDEYIITLGNITNGTPQQVPVAIVQGLPTLTPPEFNYNVTIQRTPNVTVYYNAAAYDTNLYNIVKQELEANGFQVTIVSSTQQVQYPLVNGFFTQPFAPNWVVRNKNTGAVVSSPNGWAQSFNGTVGVARLVLQSNGTFQFNSLTQAITGVPVGTILTIKFKIVFPSGVNTVGRFVVHTGLGAGIQEIGYTGFLPGTSNTYVVQLPLSDPNNLLIGFYAETNNSGTFERVELMDVEVFYDVTTSYASVVAPDYNNFFNQNISISVNGPNLNQTYTFPFTGGAPGTNVYLYDGLTIAYNKQKQGWTSYYSFIPEYYGRVRDYIVSFKSGQLWIHDRSTVAKNFYGIQYNRQLTYVSNKDFPKVKDFKAISINGIGLNDVPSIRILPFQGYINGMLSSLSKRFFQVLEGIQYAYFQKDRLSPGFGGNQLQALANGRNLKGQVLEVTLENDDTAKSSIYSSDIVYFYSEHS
jgi:hypothetical protein